MNKINQSSLVFLYNFSLSEMKVTLYLRKLKMKIKGSNKIDDSKLNSKVILVLIMLFAFIITGVYKITFPTTKADRKVVKSTTYFSNFNESFNGIIIDKKRTIQAVGDNKLMLLKVKLLESSINFYDPRDSCRLYFCIIEYPYAELFIREYFYNRIMIGDSCQFDGNLDLFRIGYVRSKKVFWEYEKPFLHKNILYFKNLHTILNKNGFNEPDEKEDYYRIFIEKFKTEEEFRKFKTDYERRTLSILDVLISKQYIISEKNDSIYVYHKDRFYSYNSAYNVVKKFEHENSKIIKYDKNGQEIKIAYPSFKRPNIDVEEHPEPFEISDDYYMLLFMKTKNKKKVHQYFKKLEKKVYYSDDLTLSHKHFERRGKSYYLFYSKKRYGSYKVAVKAWKRAGFNELYIVKFDRHNMFIKIMEKSKKRSLAP